MGMAVFYEGCLTQGGESFISRASSLPSNLAQPLEKLEKVWGRREEKEFLNVAGNHVSEQKLRNPQVKEKLQLSHIRLSDSAQYDSK